MVQFISIKSKTNLKIRGSDVQFTHNKSQVTVTLYKIDYKYHKIDSAHIPQRTGLVFIPQIYCYLYILKCFIFILFFPHQSLAHEGEQHLENEHDSPNSHSESHEEGSGMR